MKLPKTREVMAMSLMRMLMAGPEVSFNGSPTVSPITAFLCSGSFFLTLASSAYSNWRALRRASSASLRPLPPFFLHYLILVSCSSLIFARA
jgi:hypothetical protein